jgi:membrane-associated phospholipid phosphatase
MKRWLPERDNLIALVSAYVVFAATYLTINHYSVGRAAHRLFLPGEAQIPFVPEFEFLYGLGYVLPVLAAWQLPDAARRRQLLRALALTLLVAYSTYLAYPVYFERPALTEDSLATWLLALEYQDHSYNHFPSLHVATAWLIYFAIGDRPRCRRWLLAAVIGISLSTVFVKQHYIVDVVYGLALATASWMAVRERSAVWQRVT